MRPHPRVVAALGALCLALACAGGPPPGRVVHVMKPGETVYRLSRHYRVPVSDILRVNRIRDPSDIPVGAHLVIPGTRRAPPEATLRLASVRPPDHVDRRALARREADLEFAWPLHGRYSSGYGRRGRRRHEGIDIAARTGTPVRAAEAGRVIESGWLGAYGRIVVVKHAGPYTTVYAHNRRNRVRTGDFVEKGQVLAEVGSTGNASGPHLHFEVRRQRRAENPLYYLPTAAPAARAR